MAIQSYILGLDIGGANTKAALIEFQEDKMIKIFTEIKYYPFWEENIQQLPSMLEQLCSSLVKKCNIGLGELNNIAVSITAELSDVFQTKKEGIRIVLNALKTTFKERIIKVISNSNKFLSVKEAFDKPLTIAGANWVATALYVGSYEPNCILIDAGSTTIDLIPIRDGLPNTYGKDDVSRIMYHELLYTGALRATIPSITHFVPYKGKEIRISFEKFALIADVHRILGNISEEEYNCDTADNRSKSIDDCYARLSRIICGDTDMINQEDLNIIAEFIYFDQIKIISDEIQEFMRNLTNRLPHLLENPLFIITGLGENFLIKIVLESLGYNNILSFSDLVEFPDKIKSSAIAVAGALKLLT